VVCATFAQKLNFASLYGERETVIAVAVSPFFDLQASFYVSLSSFGQIL